MFKDFIMLDGCKVDCGGTGPSLNSVLGNTEAPIGKKGIASNSFFLVLNGNRKAYTIIAKNENERDRWLEAVTRAM